MIWLILIVLKISIKATFFVNTFFDSFHRTQILLFFIFEEI